MEVEDVEDDGNFISLAAAEANIHQTQSSSLPQSQGGRADSSLTSPSNQSWDATSYGTAESRITTSHSLPPDKTNVFSNKASHLESCKYPLETFEMERVQQTGSTTDLESRITQTPSPKPTDFYIWQPMKPGYAVRMESPLVLNGRTPAAANTYISRQNVEQSESGLRQAIPIMPRPWSIACCLFNIFVPGLGK